jgi:hypothetical protein
MQVEQYLVLKTVNFKINGMRINLHEKGYIFLSYIKKEDAEEASENGKYQIITLENK